MLGVHEESLPISINSSYLLYLLMLTFAESSLTGGCVISKRRRRSERNTIGVGREPKVSARESEHITNTWRSERCLAPQSTMSFAFPR